MPELTGHECPELPTRMNTPLGRDLFLRMTYSALVDADSLDAEAHGLGCKPNERGSEATLAELWSRYELFLANQSLVPDSPVNRVRRDVYDACLRSASAQRGVFRLTVPTGGGKTRSAMAFALRHGIYHDLRRVIVAVPFTTITQQTASCTEASSRGPIQMLEGSCSNTTRRPPRAPVPLAATKTVWRRR